MSDNPQKHLREEIRTKLNNLIDKTLEEQKEEFESLFTFFNVSVNDFRNGVLTYTLGIGEDKFENKEYQDVVMRLVLHFHNIVKGTYHLNRHRTACEYLKNAEAKKIIDIGYGVPGPYIFEYLKEQPNTKFTLADQDENAEKFSKLIIEKKYPEHKDNFSYLLHDMNTFDPPKDFDTYVMLDSIEHCIDPTRYLNELVKIAPNANFIFSIPICPMESLEGFHFYEWLTTESADRWLNDAGLKVCDSKNVPVNPEVDFFAEFVRGGYFNYLVRCKLIED